MTTISTSNRENFTADDLQPALGARWVLRPRHLAACVVLSAVFLFVNAIPIFNWSIWSDVSLGRWMLAHRSLPASDPTQPLSAGVHGVHTTWLSQLALGTADRLGGPQAVSNLFTALTMAWLAILTRVVYRKTGRVGLMLGGVGLALAMGAGSGLFAGIEVFGMLCFAVLLWLLTWLDHQPTACDQCQPQLHQGRTWAVWLGVAGLFALWANLHDSYLLGIAMLACYALARGCEVAWQTKSLRPVLADASFRVNTALATTAVLASFVNPYGPGLALANLDSLHGEQALRPLSPQDAVFFVSLALLALLPRVSGRRVRRVDVLLVVAFGAAVLAVPQVQSWYALAYTCVAMPYVAEIVDRWFARADDSPRIEVGRVPAELAGRNRTAFATHQSDKPAALTARSFIYTLLCGLTLYSAFSLAPGSQVLLGGSPRPTGDLIGSNHLYQGAMWLREHVPRAFIYAPVGWSDLMVGLGGDGVRAMMTSNAQWVPPGVRSDHGRIGRGADGWEATLDRYAVDTLVLSSRQHAVLIQAVRASPLWTVVYEAGGVWIARRQK